MLARALKRIIDEKLSSVSEIAELAGVSTSTIYRWMGRESQPDFDSIRLIVRHLPDQEAQRAIIAAFTGGTAWHFDHQSAEDLDLNRDGRVDADDALDASIRLVRSAGNALVLIREASSSQNLTREDVAAVINVLNRMVQHCSIAQQVLVRLWEENTRHRRKARPSRST